ncbi:hypothetical protein JWZ98_22300 [Methylomonas sp. EFPC1]|uniref:hypothetical protein n=1 Tax=Methylomonas sp. EFPC1 TaxID=2812647 RepID=UPI001966F57B|nr:hypothetical protein [Methylomonas sp. EFPC1]QSB01327.1 hypothetical protein JWZ98_22300 [Methylomonas sp. EFPC1]
MRLANDQALRQALHGMYVALFNAVLTCTNDFRGGRLTTMLTAIMGIEDCGWRVVGITQEALDLLATEDFNKNKLPRKLCRGHITDRVKTTRLMFEREKPLKLDEFFKIFLENDCTVIMLNEQNNHTKPFPVYIKIDNPDAKLFPNGSLMSWKHRSKERDFLRRLHSKEL